MSEQDDEAFEERSRALFRDSVEGLDIAVRSRLTQARSAALAAAQAGGLGSSAGRCGRRLPA